jgi:hypothetical protein
VKTLTHVAGLGPPGLGARVVDVFHREVELILVMLAVAAIVRCRSPALPLQRQRDRRHPPHRPAPPLSANPALSNLA